MRQGSKYGRPAAVAAALALMAVTAVAQGRGQVPGGGAAAAPTRTIERVTGDLYKVVNGGQFPQVTMVLVTTEGIVLTDPLSPEVSAWLKAELATRFPGRPVRFVINSHYHWDHARGGGMFADTAKFVAHENFPKNLALPIRQARPPGDTDDLDGDNRLTRDEAQTGTRGNFDRMNGNGDGFLTQDEMAADIRRPDITFGGERYTVTLGGKRVELIHAGNRHTSDMIDMYFPDERVLFVGDYVQLNRLCCNFAFDRKPLASWIASFKRLEQLDFDTIVHAHADVGTKADLVASREWIEDLSAAVAAGIKAGRSAEELQKTIRLVKYKAWAGYEQQLPVVVKSAYDNLTKYPAP